MRAVMMLTTGFEEAFAMARRLREGMPEAEWTAFVCDDDREALLPALVGCVIRSDKPRGSKLRFLRGLRAQRFDVAFVAWHGGERPQPLKFAALACGAKDVVAVDEVGRSFAVRWWAPWTWAGHAVRRLGQLRVLRALRFFANAYRATVGRLVQLALLVPETQRVRRLPRAGR
jgi:hypothetical protein